MKKLSIALIALILIPLLFTPGCTEEEEFNVVGVWNATMTWLMPITASVESRQITFGGTMTFTGSETSGTCIINIEGIATCSYQVNGTAITISGVWDNMGPTINLTGTASADFNSMSGTLTQSNGFTGSWTATR